MRDRFPYLSLAATLLLLLTAALPAAISLAGLAALALLLRPRRRETLVLAVGLLAAASVCGAGAVAARLAESPSWSARAERRFEQLVDRIEAAAGEARAAAAGLTGGSARVQAFDRLSALAATDGGEWSYLLFDQDGEAVAWSGEGLLHEVDPARDRPESTGFVSSYTAATLYASRRVGEGSTAWSIVAGRSFPRDRLPFSAGVLLERRAYRWWIESDAGASTGASSAARLESGRGFTLRAARDPAVDLTRRTRWLATLLLGAALLVAALDHGRAVFRAGSASWALAPMVVAVAGVALLARAGGATLAPLVVLAVATVVAAAWSRLGSTRIAARATWPLAVLGAGLPLALAWGAQQFDVTPDLGVRLGVAGSALAYRAAMVLLALAAVAPRAFALAPRAHLASAAAATTVAARASLPPTAAAAPSADLAADRRGARQLGIALALLLLAGAWCDHAPAAVFLLLAGGAAAIVARDRSVAAAGRWLIAVVIACLVGALSWEIPHRQSLRARWERDLAAVVGPPLDARAIQLATEMEAFLQSEAARDIVSAPTTPGARRDLAVTLWRRSPLARRDVASAVQVDVGAPEPSLFSYGLTIREGEIDPESLPAGGVRADRWIDGGGTIESYDRSHAVLFWIVPLAAPTGRATFEELEIDLLRGRLAVEGTALPGGAALAVHEGDRALLLPWPRTTPPERGARGVADTPAGPAWYWSRRHDGITSTVYLPRLGPFAGLERVGIHAVGSLLAAGALAALGLLLVLGDESFRQRLGVRLRSYSRRLILILTVLIVVPLLLLDAVLVRALDQRLETEHREAAEVALKVAQRVLSEYLLALEPGFGIRAVLEQEVLDWLAQVVDREVNVYWGSQSFASSRPELFTAGLLPTRIPGDVFSELALRQDALAARTRTAAGRTYLELYAALDVSEPEVPIDRRFYLSTPLVAQGEEVGIELARLGRRIVVVTVALLLLVLAVGARLAAGFTRPVMQIVEGTDRIARGAATLGLEPSEPELRTLVRAIDEMARRVAQGRADLVREKHVIEKMIESITAAVVSLDQDHRVMLHNQAATTLLGVEVGAPIAGVAAAAPIAGLAAFLREATAKGAPAAGRLRSAGGEDREWSVVWVPVPGGGDPAALLVVEDVTEILRAQRLEAWAEMARIIAHEVKNPLTPIRLSTEHMQQVFASDPQAFREVFERCTRNILVQVEELRAIASEFSTYSRVPNMDLRPGDVVALARTITGAYQAAPPPGVTIRLESAVPAAPARFDERLLSRVLRNLLENAVRASGDRGQVEVRVGVGDGAVTLEVADRGPGVGADDMSRIFEPYFSTHDTGTGLGLPIARRIVEAHSGTIAAINRPGGGLAVRITLPLHEPRSVA